MESTDAVSVSPNIVDQSMLPSANEALPADQVATTKRFAAATHVKSLGAFISKNKVLLAVVVVILILVIAAAVITHKKSKPTKAVMPKQSPAQGAAQSQPAQGAVQSQPAQGAAQSQPIQQKPTPTVESTQSKSPTPSHTDIVEGMTAADLERMRAAINDDDEPKRASADDIVEAEVSTAMPVMLPAEPTEDVMDLQEAIDAESDEQTDSSDEPAEQVVQICSATKTDGNQCTRTVAVGELCRLHYNKSVRS